MQYSIETKLSIVKNPIVFENTQGIVFPNANSNEYFSIAERANAISLLRRALQSYNGIILKGMKIMADEMAGIGRERQKNFLSYCQHLIRENFVYRFQSPELNYMNPEESTFSIKFSPFVNERNVFDLMEELSKAEKHIGQNVNAKMVFFDLALRLTVLLKR
jgi:hypothetical protein